MVLALNRVYGKLIERKDKAMLTHDTRTPVSIAIMIGAAITVGLASLHEPEEELRRAMTRAALDAYQWSYWGHPDADRWIRVANTIDAFVELRNQRDALVLVQRADAELIASLNARVAELESATRPTPEDLGMTDGTIEATEATGDTSENGETGSEGATDEAENPDSV